MINKKPYILSIETSGKYCSASISGGDKIIHSEILKEERSHAAGVTVIIDKALKSSGLKTNDLHAIAVSEGPGSYTGLRIGVSVAKAMCYASEIPLIAVSTLKIMLLQLFDLAAIKNFEVDENDLFVPMIDARRMEVYQAVFSYNTELLRKIEPKIIDKNSYSDLLKEHNVIFFGNGADKCQEVISHENAVFVSGIEPEAKYMINPALEKYKSSIFENTAYYEPFYLKAFQATKPKNKLTGSK